ncbi:helix-turn-helix transcriptional regulator [Maribacter sp. 2304DJ31-5]|uniref:helix-turn-helix transcriptional regulator n=1 Tax=Maribacter sp. 2304DJ31-5 TaxID=3386273 RepID=UPI0039BC4109
MSEEKPRLARLTAIITQLRSRQLVTAKAIAEEHGVSIRTVYRDIRTLEKSGIPIITEEGRGYSLMEGFQLPPVMFSEEEANALIIAEHLILKNKDASLVENYKNAITKIKSILKNSQQVKTEFLSERIQVRNNTDDEKTSDYLIQLQSTIANFRLVKLNYVSLDNKKTERTIEPFALYTTQENWILIAFCRLKNDFRAFRLDRIQKLQVGPEHFKPHKITLEQYLEACRKKWDPPLT